MKPSFEPSGVVPFSEADFISLPAKSFQYRGINWSRSTLLRLRDQGRVQLARFRFSGSTKPRVYVLRESLDRFIAEQLAEQDFAHPIPDVGTDEPAGAL